MWILYRNGKHTNIRSERALSAGSCVEMPPRAPLVYYVNVCLDQHTAAYVWGCVSVCQCVGRCVAARLILRAQHTNTYIYYVLYAHAALWFRVACKMHCTLCTCRLTRHEYTQCTHNLHEGNKTSPSPNTTPMCNINVHTIIDGFVVAHAVLVGGETACGGHDDNSQSIELG